MAEIAKKRPVMLWVHTDAIKREWSLLELLGEFNLPDLRCSQQARLPTTMARAYSALDLTLGIGEG